MAQSIKTYTVNEPLIALAHKLGEGPYYDDSTKVFRWLDIPTGEVHTMDTIQGPSSHKMLSKQSFPIGVTANVKGRTDCFLVAAHPFLGLMDRTTGKCTPLSETSTLPWTSQGWNDELRFNDGSVDARGRLWVGTMKDPESGLNAHPVGSLYRVDHDLSVHRVRKGVSIPNGTSWAPGNKTMYWTESLRGIMKFDYDLETGELSNERVLFAPSSGEGAPDGHAMDAEGFLWVAMFGGWSVKRVSPEGTVVAEVRLPTRCVTAPRFVGEELYITTAQEMEPEKYPESVKQGGNVFKVHVGIQGAPIYEFSLEA